MADTNTTVHIGENSPEQVAFKLMERIASVESKLISSPNASGGWSVADRKWILQAYHEALLVVRGYEPKK